MNLKAEISRPYQLIEKGLITKCVFIYNKIPKNPRNGRNTPHHNKFYMIYVKPTVSNEIIFKTFPLKSEMTLSLLLFTIVFEILVGGRT